MTISRRDFIKLISASAGAAAVGGCAGPDATTGRPAAGRVLVIGAGYGGATAAKYVKMWAPDIDVVLIERANEFISCPISNLVLGGSIQLKDVTVSYDGLRKRGIRVVRGDVVSVDAAKREVRLADGGGFGYDRLIVSPGIDFMYDEIRNYQQAESSGRVLHAWKAGPQTVALRRQLEAMRNGGVYILAMPLAPYRCPPGPYERVCQVAHYFKTAKPKSKVLLLDANPDVTSKGALFRAAWKDLYGGIIEYRPNYNVVEVDTSSMTVKTEFETVKGDVLNVVPPHKAGLIAERAGLITANNRWCGIDWLSAESLAQKNIHVLGDATLSAPAMPKSASMANQHAKVCAAAVISLIKGQPVNPAPVLINACYSFVSDKEVIHVTSVHAYDASQKTMISVKGAGGVSERASELEGTYAWGWARNIWADTLV